MSDQSVSTSVIDDNRAVAPVIGVVILFGFLILALSMYQVEIVPQQNAEMEFQHSGEVRNDLVELRAGILQAGSIDQPQYQTVQLGTTYSTRTFTINPPSPAGTIRTTDPYPITISNNSGTPEGTITIPTRFIEYQPGYNELDRSPTWYDASVLYLDARDEGGGIAVIEDQALINGGEVQITALQNEFRRSGTGQVTVELRPAENVSGDIPEGDLTVTVPTRLSENDWETKTSLPTGSDVYDGVTDTGKDINNMNVYNLTLNTTTNDLTVDTVGVQEAPETPAQNGNARIGGDSDSGNENGNGPVVKDPGTAFDDANDNNRLDDGETTYEVSELYTFNNNSVNLVIPEGVGSVEQGSQVNIRANSIVSEVDIKSTNNQVVLTATGGSLTAASSTISARNNVNMRSSGDVSLDNSMIESQNTQVTINTDNGEVSASGTTINARNNVNLRSTEGVSVDNAVIDSQNTQVTIVTDGELTATDSQITARNNIVLRSTTASDISIDNADIESKQSQVTIDTLGELSAINSMITSRSNIYLQSTGDMSLTGATIDSEQGQLTIETDSELTAAGSSISTRSNIVLRSTGDMYLDNADIDSQQGQINANLGGNFVLHINGTTVNDNDNTIQYNPSGVTENPDRPIAQ